MHPILIKLGPFTVYSYGVMVAIGFAIATFCIYGRAPKFNIDKDKSIDLTIVALIFGILGARGLYILLNISSYIANPMEIIMLSKGGLVWYGGFIAAIVAIVIYMRISKMDAWSVGDLMAPYLALAQAFGRIGCYLNGCCYGIENACGERLPTQLISAGLLFLIFLILRVWQDKRRFPGEIFLGYCVIYSCKRFLIEFLRGDNPKIFFGLTMSQIVSAIIFLVTMSIFISRSKQWKKRTAISK